jgi:hypothetical protein
MHSPWDARLVGIEIHSSTIPLVTRWANHSGVQVDSLRQALDDVILVDTMTPKNSETFRYEYLTVERKVADIDRWLPVSDSVVGEEPPTVPFEKPLTRFLRHEPERSQRVLKQVFANWLVVCDLPPDERPASMTEGVELFHNPKERKSASVLAPEALFRWFASAELSKISIPAFRVSDDTWAERKTRANLIVAIAEQWYLRENKKMPGSVDDLIGLYLKRIPDGYEPELR